MKKIKLTIVSVFLIFSLLSCQTIKQKTDAIVEKENKKLSAFNHLKCAQLTPICINQMLRDLKRELAPFYVCAIHG